MLALSPPRAAYFICIIQIWFAHRTFSASYCVYQVGPEYALLGFCLEVQQMMSTRKKQLHFNRYSGYQAQTGSAEYGQSCTSVDGVGYQRLFSKSMPMTETCRPCRAILDRTNHSAVIRGRWSLASCSQLVMSRDPTFRSKHHAAPPDLDEDSRLMEKLGPLSSSGTPWT
jgi:hypothetical protein